MMGTSLLSVPWALSKSGLGTGLAIGFGMSMIAAYTASVILKTHRKESKAWPSDNLYSVDILPLNAIKAGWQWWSSVHNGWLVN